MIKRYMWIVFGLLFALVACSGEKETAQVEGSSNVGSTTQAEVIVEDTTDESESSAPSENFLLANLPAPSPDVFVLPELDIDAKIAFSHDDVLYLADFNAQEATILSNSALNFTVQSMGDRRFVYTAVGSESPENIFNRYNSIFVYDAAEDVVLSEYLLVDDDHFSDVDGWSDDRQWVAITQFLEDGRSTEIIASDGSFSSGSLSNITAVTWLADNTALLFEFDDSIDDVGDVLRYDPASDSYLDVEIDLAALTDDTSTYDSFSILWEQLAAQDLQLAVSSNVEYRFIIDPDHQRYIGIRSPDNPSSTGICDLWSVVRAGNEDEGEILYEVENTHALTNIHQLPDGSIVVMRWFKEDCVVSEPLQAEVIHIESDGTTSVVAQDIYVNVQNLGNNFFRPIAQRMDVSADGRYMIWVSQEELTRGDVAINLTDLATGNSAELLVTPEADGVLFRSVTWID